MTVSNAIKAIRDYIVAVRSNRVTNEQDSRAWIALRELMGTDLSPAPQWLRHEGGEMPEGVTPETVVAVVYDNNSIAYGGNASDRDWEQGLWYYVVPAPPKAKPGRWRAEFDNEYWFVDDEGSIGMEHDCTMHRDDARFKLGNYFRTREDAEAAAARVRRAYLNEPDPRVEGLVRALREISHGAEVNQLWWARLATDALRAWEEGTPHITREWDGLACTIATVTSSGLRWHEDRVCAGREAGANARIIAAAPEMLEALEYIVQIFSEPAFGGEDVQAMHHMALRAIAKAKGKPHD